MGNFAALLIAAALLLGNAFFVGAEFALISLRRSQIEPRAEAGSRPAKITLKAMENVSLMMAGAQLGITMCSLGLGALGEPAVAHLLEVPFAAINVPGSLLHPIAFTIALGIVVFLHMVLGEMVPKNLALAGPTRSALLLGPILYAIVFLLKPVIVTLNAIGNAILRLFKVEPKDEVASAFTREQVAVLVAESKKEGLLKKGEHELLEGALSFPERSIRTVLIPTSRLEVLDTGITPAEVEAKAAQTGFSRFPVRDAGGELMGYLHLKDVLEEDLSRRVRKIPAKRIRPMPTLAADEPLDSALHLMQERGTHLARVREPDGKEIGVVTLEDVLEELVGVIRDATQSA
jgi:CBS domain containing-hemolysin-like protein